MSIVPIVCDVKDLQPLIRSMSHHRLFLPIQHSGQLHKSALTPLCSNILADHQSQGGPVYDLGLAFIMPNFTLQIELVCHGAWAISFFSISRNDAMTVDILKRFSLLRKGSSKLKRIPFTEILIRPLRFLKVVFHFPTELNFILHAFMEHFPWSHFSWESSIIILCSIIQLNQVYCVHGDRAFNHSGSQFSTDFNWDQTVIAVAPWNKLRLKVVHC